MSLWLYLHFPRLQLDSVFAEQHEQAIIIIHGNKNIVVQLNTAAHQHGIKTGMGLGTAAALCSNLQVQAYAVNVETQRLREIAQYLYVMTSDISFFAPDGILLRISNMLALYKGLEHYWTELKTHLQPLQVSYQYSCAYSPLAARLLARVGVNRVTEDKQLLSQYIAQQPLTATELSYKTIDKLSRVGIHKVGELVNLPMAELARRFDIELVNYLGRLSGQFKHPVDFYHPKPEFCHYLELLFEIENVQWLQRPLQNLLVKLEHFLKLRDQLAHELVLQLHQRDTDKVELIVTSAAGEYQASKWIKLFALRLENISLSAPVMALTLKAKRIADRTAVKADLFAGNQGKQSPLELISLLQAKLGQQAVRGLTLSDDPRPDLTNQLSEPLQEKPKIAVNPHIIRPSILLPKPCELREKVLIVRGPERLLTGWWDNKPMHRDYFVARSKSGQWLWVFRNHQQQWFVHGIFS